MITSFCRAMHICSGSPSCFLIITCRSSYDLAHGTMHSLRSSALHPNIISISAALVRYTHPPTLYQWIWRTRWTTFRRRSWDLSWQRCRVLHTLSQSQNLTPTALYRGYREWHKHSFARIHHPAKRRRWRVSVLYEYHNRSGKRVLG